MISPFFKPFSLVSWFPVNTLMSDSVFNVPFWTFSLAHWSPDTFWLHVMPSSAWRAQEIRTPNWWWNLCARHFSPMIFIQGITNETLLHAYNLLWICIELWVISSVTNRACMRIYAFQTLQNIASLGNSLTKCIPIFINMTSIAFVAFPYTYAILSHSIKLEEISMYALLALPQARAYLAFFHAASFCFPLAFYCRVAKMLFYGSHVSSIMNTIHFCPWIIICP